MVWLVVLVMIMWVARLGVVIVLEPKELILCWTQFPTRTLFAKSLYVIAGLLLVLPTLSTDYLATDYCPN